MKTIPATLPATLRAFCTKNAEKISWVSDERQENNLIWICLAPGWFNAEAATTSIQEATASECIKAFRSFVRPIGTSLSANGPTQPC